MKTLMIVNDIIWVITAILCVFFDNIVLTCVICVTTIIYFIDLAIKFKCLNYNVKQFFKLYWLDVLFLIPFCKIFRGFKILKVGKMLRFFDITCDFFEIIFRLFRFVLRF